MPANIKQLLLCVLLSAGWTVSRTFAQDAPPATQPGTTVVNMHMHQAVAEDAFHELAKQSGIKFSVDGNMWDQDSMQSPMDVDLTNRSFWSATLELCSLWNVQIQQNYGVNVSGRIHLSQFGGPPHTAKAPVFESQGILVQATSFRRQQNVPYGSPANSRDFSSIELMVYVDPAMHVQSLDPSAKAELAVDDGGHSMLPSTNNVMRYGGGPQQEFIFPCHVPLNYPDNAGKKIADLKFTVRLRAGDKLDSMVVEKPLDAKGVSKVFGDTTVTFQSLTKDDGGNYALKLGVSQNSNQGTSWNLFQNGKLLDEKGRPFLIRGTQGGGRNNGSRTSTVTILYAQSNDDADDQSAPAKWTIELPADAHTISVPVEFKDLALP